MRFEFATANRIIFGSGTLSQVGHLASELGERALVLSGFAGEQNRVLQNLLADHNIVSELYYVSKEPTVKTVQQAMKTAQDISSDLIIGFGGGSAIDTGKAIAALMTNEGDIYNYLEVIGHGKPIIQPPLPYIAIPTTAGTGAEVTRNAVIGSPDHKVKVSLRSPLMLPKISLIDPELTYSLPREITAGTGMDAVTQVLEPYVSKMSNPMTDAFCREGLRLASRSLERAYLDGSDRIARQEMSLVSLFGGLALANAKLGAVHGFASPLGGMFDAPHGAVCARLLPVVMAVNVRALQSRGKELNALDRYDEVGCYLTGDANATADDGVEWVHALSEKLDIPPLAAYGVRNEDIPNIIAETARASSMRGNPIELTHAELSEIMELAL
jgi:alcohol dehydrogenase class IV